eukprot:SAG31_NODE_17160_length_681_cov_0.898625_1_plen_144_part_01
MVFAERQKGLEDYLQKLLLNPPLLDSHELAEFLTPETKIVIESPVRQSSKQQDVTSLPERDSIVKVVEALGIPSGEYMIGVMRILLRPPAVEMLSRRLDTVRNLAAREIQRLIRGHLGRQNGRRNKLRANAVGVNLHASSDIGV